jgi:hypothetical protein
VRNAEKFWRSKSKEFDGEKQTEGGGRESTPPAGSKSLQGATSLADCRSNRRGKSKSGIGESEMQILLAFAPFIVFVVIVRLVGGIAGLVAAAIISAALLAREVFGAGRMVKVLEIGTFVLFAGLAIYAKLAGAAWSIFAVRLRVDAGLLLVVLVSIVIHQPFTLQYAREQVTRELWNTPAFLRVNYIITGVWAAAFAIMVAADLLLLYVPSLPPSVGIVATIAALCGAVSFTSQYPERKRSPASKTSDTAHGARQDSSEV